MRRKMIYTSNRELYDKLHSLHFLDKVILETVSSSQITKILKNINKNSKIVDVEKNNNTYTLKKVGKYDFSIYFTKK